MSVAGVDNMTKFVYKGMTNFISQYHDIMLKTISTNKFKIIYEVTLWDIKLQLQKNNVTIKNKGVIVKNS